MFIGSYNRRMRRFLYKAGFQKVKTGARRRRPSTRFVLSTARRSASSYGTAAGRTGWPRFRRRSIGRIDIVGFNFDFIERCHRCHARHNRHRDFASWRRLALAATSLGRRSAATGIALLRIAFLVQLNELVLANRNLGQRSPALNDRFSNPARV
jgi:hypothetical protein